jgi:hypothetical protein
VAGYRKPAERAMMRGTSMRIPAIALLVVFASGCERQSVPPPAANDPADAPVSAREPNPYAAYEFPSISDDWGPSEYARVRDVLIEIERNAPELLPTFAGPKGDVLARVTSLDAIAEAIAGTPDMDAMFELAESVAAIYKLYANRVITHQQPYGPEYLQLTATVLRAMSSQFARLTTVIDEATLRADSVRREGLLQMRHGLFVLYVGALQTPLMFPTVVDADAAVARLEPVAVEVAQFLLPDDRQFLDQLLTALAGAGADTSRVAATRATIAGSPMHPIIAAFAEEAQAFSADKQKLFANVADQLRLPVEVGRERGGVRYAFPEAGFSAVFHQPPNAMLTTSSATDGVEVTMRVLGIRDATGYSTAIVCTSRSEPLANADERGFARALIEDAKGTDIREVEIDGRRGFEGTFANSITRGFMRAVELGHGGCMISAEFPPPLASSYDTQARAFLDSVKLGGFEG